MAYEPNKRRDVPGSQPLRLDQPETGAAQRPWFGTEPAVPIGAPQTAASRVKPTAPRPVDVQPISDDVLGGGRQSNWLLELEGDTPVEAPVEARAEALVEVESIEPLAPLTSYVEPETTGTLVSRALAPAGLALVLSFLAVGGFAFWKSGGVTGGPVGADPLDADPSIVSGQRAAELVAPPSSGGSSEPKRSGTLRAGTAPAPPTFGQQPARSAPTGVAPVVTPVTTPRAQESTFSSIEPDPEFRSSMSMPEPEVELLPEVETVDSFETAVHELDGTATGEVALPSGEDELTDLEASLFELNDLLRALVIAAPIEESDSALVGGVAETQPPLDPSLVASSEPLSDGDLFEELFRMSPRAPAIAAPVVAGGAAEASLDVEPVVEPVVEHVVELDTESDVQHATETGVEVADLAPLAGPDPAPVFTGEVDPAAVTAPEPSAEDVPLDIRLDLDWEELMALAVEPTPGSAVVAEATVGAHESVVREPSPVLATSTVLDTPSASEVSPEDSTLLADSTVLDDSTHSAPTLVGPEIEWPSLDWDKLTEPVPAAPVLVGPMLDGPMLDGPMLDGPMLDGAELDVTTPDETAALALAPSAEHERSRDASDTLPTEPLGPDAPLSLSTTGNAGLSDADPYSTALANEVESLLATVGPRQGPVEARESVELPIAAETPPTSPTVGATEPLAAAPSDIPVEVMPPVATPDPGKGLRSVLRRAGEEGTWTALDVPNTVVVGPEVLLTPYTGNVRVVFGGGDVFEGRLHAVGQNQVTLDTRLGRMTLDARRLERIERLAPEGPAPKSPAKVANDTSGLDEVRVTTRGGGTFVGHLVSRDGNQVTLIVVEGYRMTVEAVEVTPAVGGRATSILRRPGDKGSTPARPTKPTLPNPR